MCAGRLVGRRFEVSRWSRLPRNRRLLGLFYQTAKTGLSSPDQFGITALKKGRKENVQVARVTAREQYVFRYRVSAAGNRFCGLLIGHE